MCDKVVLKRAHHGFFFLSDERTSEHGHIQIDYCSEHNVFLQLQ